MLLLITLGCGLGTVDVSIDAPACSDWVFGEDFGDPEVTVEYSETEINVVREGVFMDCNARFDPAITAEGGMVSVEEAWEGEEGDCCFSPEVVLTTERGGPLLIQWFDAAGSEVYSQEIDTRE